MSSPPPALKAAITWNALAEAGDIEALAALAGLYVEGHGTRRNLEAAVRWYRRAAAAGDAVAQMNLGDFYSRGVGVPRDLVRAYVWLSRAAAQGRVWAKTRREAIAREMTSAQLSEAEARLKDGPKNAGG